MDGYDQPWLAFQSKGANESRSLMHYSRSAPVSVGVGHIRCG